MQMDAAVNWDQPKKAADFVSESGQRSGQN
jgi:hypothetical protein